MITAYCSSEMWWERTKCWERKRVEGVKEEKGGGECAAKEEKIKKAELPVATILSPGASIPPGGRI